MRTNFNLFEIQIYTKGGYTVITHFNSKSVYLGPDLRRFNEIRDYLDQAHIRYKYKVKNRMGQWAGRGTIRSNTGSAGQPAASAHEYEILVHKDDFEKIRLPQA